jgi:hypothetical protein
VAQIIKFYGDREERKEDDEETDGIIHAEAIGC